MFPDVGTNKYAVQHRQNEYLIFYIIVSVMFFLFNVRSIVSIAYYCCFLYQVVPSMSCRRWTYQRAWRECSWRQVSAPAGGAERRQTWPLRQTRRSSSALPQSSYFLVVGSLPALMKSNNIDSGLNLRYNVLYLTILDSIEKAKAFQHFIFYAFPRVKFQNPLWPSVQKGCPHLY